jgi:hypothetical protein
MRPLVFCGTEDAWPIWAIFPPRRWEATDLTRKARLGSIVNICPCRPIHRRQPKSGTLNQDQVRRRPRKDPLPLPLPPEAGDRVNEGSPSPLKQGIGSTRLPPSPLKQGISSTRVPPPPSPPYFVVYSPPGAGRSMSYARHMRVERSRPAYLPLLSNGFRGRTNVSAMISDPLAVG